MPALLPAMPPLLMPFSGFYAERRCRLRFGFLPPRYCCRFAADFRYFATPPRHCRLRFSHAFAERFDCLSTFFRRHFADTPRRFSATLRRYAPCRQPMLASCTPAFAASRFSSPADADMPDATFSRRRFASHYAPPLISAEATPITPPPLFTPSCLRFICRFRRHAFDLRRRHFAAAAAADTLSRTRRLTLH
jgi:hypothetical protein